GVGSAQLGRVRRAVRATRGGPRFDGRNGSAQEYAASHRPTAAVSDVPELPGRAPTAGAPEAEHEVCIGTAHVLGHGAGCGGLLVRRGTYLSGLFRIVCFIAWFGVGGNSFLSIEL